MASGAGLGLPSSNDGLKMVFPASDRLRGGPQEDAARRQSSPSTGKLSARPAGGPGSILVKESLRQSLRHHSVPVASRHLEAPQLRFLRHDGIYRPDGVWPTSKTWGRGTASRWSAPGPVPGRDGRNCCAPCSSFAMSSGRLFLDRVARQQSPSPLHRHPQLNTHSSAPRAKGDISTLPGRRHFYFALTFPAN